MYGIKELKKTIRITSREVECPVNKCDVMVVRRRRGQRTRNPIFYCNKHSIFICQSTFEYPSELDNLLWKKRDDMELLVRIKKVKTECRITHDNSEDAVSWNVFRFLEKNNLLSGFLTELCKFPVRNIEVIYWSYSQLQKGTWDKLGDARDEFGEKGKRRSEPDIIVKSEKDLFFIEAKFKSSNNSPTGKDDIKSKIKNPKKYLTGGDSWFKSVYKSDYETIINDQKYELFRFWLLGSWIAKRLGLRFHLINLVLSKREKDIVRIFGKHIVEIPGMKFLRISWEDIYDYISGSTQSADRDTLMEYYANKSMGYNPNEKQAIGKIMKAFSMQ